MLRRLITLKALRIVWSTVFATIAVLLCALWVRCSWMSEGLIRDHSDNFEESVQYSIGSWDSRVNLSVFWEDDSSETQPPKKWRYWTAPPEYLKNTPWFYWERSSKALHAAAPHWFYASIAAFLASLPWIVRRFSVRTMLIVTTLAAVFFAAVAISLRQ